MIADRLSSVWQVAGVAAAALCCYLASQSVATERAAVTRLDARIAATMDDIHRLDTEIGARGRMTQLDRWNLAALRLQAPKPGQFVANGVQLASLYGRSARPALPLDPAIAPDAAAVRVVAYQPAPPAPSRANPDADQAPPMARAVSPLLHAATYVRVKSTVLAADAPPVEQAAFKPEPSIAKPRAVALAGARGHATSLLPGDIGQLIARENRKTPAAR